LTTRPAGEGDLHFLEDVFLQAMRVHIEAARGGWNEANERKQFREQLQLCHTCVIEYGGAPAGFFMKFERGQYVELHTLCIVPEHQRRGIGSAVMDQILDDAKQKGQQVRLSVLKPNIAARRLYERLGFRVTEETPFHYQMHLELRKHTLP
jgi:ribosomal protein S18 acetylase RimI-like enzyme